MGLGKEIIKTIWNLELKDSRIYQMLDELGLSHQKAHQDYENANLDDYENANLEA
ncbi:hypothetical protein AAFM79_10685 [Trichormus azollae HNT15244]